MNDVTHLLDVLAARHGWSREERATVQDLLSLAGSGTLAVDAPRGDGAAPAADGVATDAVGIPLDRFENLGPIGRGGMAEVFRVRERALNRVMAMKVIDARLVSQELARVRFLEEAQATAQLTHPGIVPVHEVGRLPGGRLYFTMKEVRGRTFDAVIRSVHAASRGGAWLPSPDGWTLRRMVAAFLRTCEAMAFAHARGVVHRDLKPHNVMVGEYGEVQVMDWGLAKVGARRGGDADVVVVTARSGSAHDTIAGSVAGTPHYMPPEQARGDFAELGPAADVYSLGAILYELLCGAPPFDGPAFEVIDQVLRHAPPDVAERNAFGPAVPDDLAAACRKAMAREPSDRFPSAADLAGEIAGWLDGARRRERALEVVEAARSLLPRAAEWRARADLLDVQAARALRAVKPWEDAARKEPSWALQDQARRLRGDALQARLEYEGLLHAALTHDPEMPEANAALAALYEGDHRHAEATRDDAAALAAESRLRRHADALPRTHPDRARFTAYLQGDGALSLATDPPARALLLRYVVRGRRLVTEAYRDLGVTPVREVTVPRGSYLVQLVAEGFGTTAYPVWIGRGEHWDGARPGATTPHVIGLLPTSAVDPDDCHVPAGPAWTGSLVDGAALPSRFVWVDGFVIRRYPVTNTEYIAFLDDLVARGHEEEALRHAPRERGATAMDPGALIYGRRDDGTFVLRVDADGDIWLPDWPVMMVDWFGARAYARWFAARTGLPWRLPGEFEWEKAARGVDARKYPWGEEHDPSWCCMRSSHAGRSLPASVDTYPVDSSPYGVRHLAGNVRDWLCEVFRDAGPPVEDGRALPPEPADPDPTDRSVRMAERGGNWVGDAAYGRSPRRAWLDPLSRDASLGFRLCRPLG